MSYRIPTFQELYDGHLARLESEIGQESPTNDKSFLKVLAKIEAALDIGQYKYAVDATKQNLALTATGTGLDAIGNNNSTPRKQAETTIIEVELVATTGINIPAQTEFISDSNGLRYRNTADVVSVAGVATLLLRCSEIGTIGNLDNGEELSIAAQISGAETIATVIDTNQLGVDQESDEDFRPRVLFSQRAVTGGANATDHKIWSEAVTGVRRSFPYSGRPEDEGDSYPGDRTIYVESTTSVDADGIAPIGLLNSVRDAINNDPVTGESRAVLGITDATLFIESIIRTSIFVEISELDVSAEKESECKNSLSDALDLYFRAISPFIDGIDLSQERNDTITNPSISKIVQDVLYSFGATAQTVTFGLVAGVAIPLYFLNPGELAKLGDIDYV